MNRRRFIQSAAAWTVVTIALDVAQEQATASANDSDDDEDEPRSIP